VWVFAAASAPSSREDALRSADVEVVRVEASDGRLDIGAVLQALGTRGITRLLVEGGPIVAASLLAADLVDAAVLLHGPNPIGPDGIDAIAGLPLEALTGAPQLRLVGSEAVGSDTLDTFERKNLE
jgi:diaminohydroxyphosphoribosylaminopyrimidine deaminase/5-amino-6-(5-phosphoribosylamino)uracil reductase